MPIYEYICEKCGKLTDVMQKVNDPPPGQCEDCGAAGPLSRRMSRTSFVLKGGGWYSDLYGSPKKDSGTKKDETSSSSTASTGSAGSSGSTSTSSGGSSTSTTASASAGGDKK